MAEDRTIGQLVAQASEDLSALVRYEVALAKAEIKDDVKRGAVASGMFAAAGVLAFLGVITMVITVGYALVGFGLPGWLAFLIVTLGLLLIAGLLGFIGFLQVKKIKPPERAIASTKQTLAAVKGSVRS
ncbi:phage holin family protein [Kineosporia rhizophila]|uniref:phage holin family protein n=1 Tax=Kineosporia rhizophila TaxID=84633 RepID=UPI000AD35B75|nr:phage holin family protein [Kineosporia rhizophila]MCE0536013.1 phage holin family protein [Kineosporia rhizophila]